MSTTEPACALLVRTREMLAASEKSHLEIYRATGLKPSWLRSVELGETSDPGVTRIVRLYEYLSGSTLMVA